VNNIGPINTPMGKIEGVKYSFITDRFIVLLAYLLAFFSAWIAIYFIPDYDLWVKIAAADFVGTIIIFIASRLLNNSSMYDPYWSLAPIIILLYLLFIQEVPFENLRISIVTLVVVWWGVRLTGNWLKIWPGLRHEDWRYVKLSEDTGSFYWVVSFLGIHLFPTVIVYLGCLPFIPIVFSDSPVIWTDFAGFFICVFAVEIESKADRQLRKFKKSKNTRGQHICDDRLWKYSRHPNYFGEIAFWGGIFVMALGLNPSENLYYGIGFLCMVLLFIFISIPMMEKRQVYKEGYGVYRKQVSMLVPWFRKR